MSLLVAVVVASVGCAALKFAGFVVPARALDSGAAKRVVEALPIALLSGLIAVSTFGAGQHLTLASRAAGLLVAVLLVMRRAPFLVVVVAACAVAAAVHAASG